MAADVLLCVDEDPRALRSLSRLLDGEEDTVVRIASSGAHARAILTSTPVRVLICAQKLPDATGLEFIERSKATYPTTVAILLTEDAPADTIPADAPVFRALEKPCADEALRAAVRDARRLGRALVSEAEARARVEDKRPAQLEEGRGGDLDRDDVAAAWARLDPDEQAEVYARTLDVLCDRRLCAMLGVDYEHPERDAYKAYAFVLTGGFVA